MTAQDQSDSPIDSITRAMQLDSAAREALVQPARGRSAGQSALKMARAMSLDEEHLRSERVVAHRGDDAYAEPYMLLRARLLRRVRVGNWQIIGVTSAGPQEGKTVTATNLAFSIAREGHYHACLVDADLRRSGIRRALGIDGRPGLAEYLAGECSVDELFLDLGIPNFRLISGGIPSRNAGERIGAPAMQELLRELKTRYPDRLLLLDLPPALVGGDVVSLAPCLDAVLLVVAEGQTQRLQFQRALELLEDVDIAGVVLNKSVTTSQRYQYGYY